MHSIEIDFVISKMEASNSAFNRNSHIHEKIPSTVLSSFQLYYYLRLHLKQFLLNVVDVLSVLMNIEYTLVGTSEHTCVPPHKCINRFIRLRQLMFVVRPECQRKFYRNRSICFHEPSVRASINNKKSYPRWKWADVFSNFPKFQHVHVTHHCYQWNENTPGVVRGIE